MDLPGYACLSMPRERSAAPERHRIPVRDAIAPRPPDTEALGDLGEKTGPDAKLGERGASKGASRPWSPIWLGTVKTWKFPTRYSNDLCMNVLTYWYCCTCCCAAVLLYMVGVSVGGVLYVLLVVVLYCCKTPLHRACGWVANRLVLGPLVVLQRCGLLPYVLLRYVQFFSTTPAM